MSFIQLWYPLPLHLVEKIIPHLNTRDASLNTTSRINIIFGNHVSTSGWQKKVVYLRLPVLVTESVLLHMFYSEIKQLYFIKSSFKELGPIV